MAKAVITHIEILSRAIRSIEEEIVLQKDLMAGMPEFEKMLEAYIAERAPKLNALKEMYRIEAGVNY